LYWPTDKTFDPSQGIKSDDGSMCDNPRDANAVNYILNSVVPAIVNSSVSHASTTPISYTFPNILYRDIFAVVNQKKYATPPACICSIEFTKG